MSCTRLSNEISAFHALLLDAGTAPLDPHFHAFGGELDECAYRVLFAGREQAQRAQRIGVGRLFGRFE